VAAIIIQSGAVYAVCLVILICFRFARSDNIFIMFEMVGLPLLLFHTCDDDTDDYTYYSFHRLL
jgi:hypothetical protein